MAKCQICDKGLTFGRNIRHQATGGWFRRAPRTNRTFKANIQRTTLTLEGGLQVPQVLLVVEVQAEVQVLQVQWEPQVQEVHQELMVLVVLQEVAEQWEPQVQEVLQEVVVVRVHRVQVVYYH